MNQWKFEKDDTIRMVLSENKKIVYSSLSCNAPIEYLEELGLSDEIFINMFPQSCFKNEKMIIDKFILNGKPYYLITSNKKDECSNCIKVLRDEMTGLYNRNFWELIKNDTLLINIEKLSLILIDVDNLKMINDSFGHISGDKALRIVGQVIKKGIRQEDLGIRYGGDEFLILLLNKDKIAVEKIVTRIREKIDMVAKKQNIDIKVSIGIASNQIDLSMEEMVKMADRELYEEKIIKSELKEKGIKSDLVNEILEIRDELNRKVAENNNNLSDKELIKISEKLDNLIVNYLE
ncbi:diguanylate cyclase [Garciella nitratireducens]|uniref:diguanylate cyclase n=1 Tax=Garciella nitratireducens TaxID=218205 RepID=UPI001BD41611|nr:diguanylate cyclase [Garciella nitratireducens]